MTDTEQNENFLSRWSRRKLDDNESEAVTPEVDLSPPEISELDSVNPEASQSSEPAEELPIWQQKDVDPELKRNALRSLFQQAEFNYRDGLNDYDHDFTKQPKLGDIVTVQMKRMIKLAQQKAQPESERLDEAQPTISVASVSEDKEQITEHNEDDKIA
jgi:hypothetical protein